MEPELGRGSEASHDSWWERKERRKRGEQPVGVFKGQAWKDWIEERVRVAIPAEWEAWDGELPSRAEEPDCDGQRFHGMPCVFSVKQETRSPREGMGVLRIPRHQLKIPGAMGTVWAQQCCECKALEQP